ncbi:MAG TPA: hypothetical protein PKY50_13420 [Candidatus Competibacter sp.]|nr:hypothetical protein [Candidatus Competibacter sp.]
MLVMRKSQMEAFENVVAQRFEEGLLDHLRTFFPQHAATLGETQLGRIARYGLQRAESRGLKTERAIYLYVALMFVLGSRFDEDPQLPWAAREIEEEKPAPPKPEVAAEARDAATVAATAGETVTGKEDEAPKETADARIERVYGQAMAFLDQTVGPDNELLRQTLNTLRQPQVFEGLPAAPSVGHRLLLLLQMLAPEKYDMLGEETLRNLVRHGYEAAKRYGMTTEHGIMNYVALAFVLGSGFDRDPLYPWAAAALSDQGPVDPAKKGVALREAALVHLAKCLPGCPRRAEQSAVILARPAQPYKQIVEGIGEQTRRPLYTSTSAQGG